MSSVVLLWNTVQGTQTLHICKSKTSSAFYEAGIQRMKQDMLMESQYDSVVKSKTITLNTCSALLASIHVSHQTTQQGKFYDIHLLLHFIRCLLTFCLYMQHMAADLWHHFLSLFPPRLSVISDL